MPGEGERYEEFEPPASLRPFVRTIWTYAASGERVVLPPGRIWWEIVPVQASVTEG